jgi:hypothetical protein
MKFVVAALIGVISAA